MNVQNNWLTNVQEKVLATAQVSAEQWLCETLIIKYIEENSTEIYQKLGSFYKVEVAKTGSFYNVTQNAYKTKQCQNITK